MSRRCRVLVVDDSAFARKVLREVLAGSDAIEVVGIARDGLEALEKLAVLQPDVVTLDLVMPNLDGAGVLRAMTSMQSSARVVVVSMSGDDSELAIEALSLGAFELVRKPTALATDRLYELADELVGKVLAVHGTRSPTPWTVPVLQPVAVPSATAAVAPRCDLVVVGTSTGGPQALARLLGDLPADLAVPVVIALHIPRDYTEALARRLHAMSRLSVTEASDGALLAPGRVLLAPGGSNITIERVGARLAVKIQPPDGSLYVPSVDRLFSSAAAAAGSRVLGVVLTGMGDDGLRGARAIADAGGRMLSEAESSCVVYGMPRCVNEAGLATEVAPLEDMAAAVVHHVLS